jgi:RNA polymerase sigma-70 factor (ECF subfamily)
MPPGAAALDALLSRHAARAFGLARAITRDDRAAEAVAAEVVLGLLAPEEDGGDPGATDRAARRLAVAAALRRSPRPAAGEAQALAGLGPVFAADGHRAGDRRQVLADWSRRPATETLGAGARAVVERTLDRLPPRGRAALALQELEGLTVPEIAELLGCAVPEARVLLHGSRAAVREQLTRHLAAGS